MRTSLGRGAVWTLGAVAALALAGCGGGGGGEGGGIVFSGDDPLDQQVRLQALAAGLTGTPPGVGAQPVPESPLARLGMHLFFTKALSGNRDAACVTCHHPLLGGGDGLSLSIGVAAEDPDLLGPGRRQALGAVGFDGGPNVPRNAPTTFNMGLWRRDLFLDGRVERLPPGPPPPPGAPPPPPPGIRTPDSPFGVADPLAGNTLSMAQARFPVTENEEMKGFGLDHLDRQATREYLASRLGGYGAGAGELARPDYWLDQFRVAFGNPTGTATTLITEQNVARALGAYLNSQVLVDTPWRAYLQGASGAIPEAAKRGALTFLRPQAAGGAGCASCHAGDFFTDEAFHAIAIPQIGRGKGDGAGGLDDLGRARESGRTLDRYAFRTPTLLNVAVTGPFGHDGAYATMEAVVRHHLDPALGLDGYDPGQLEQPGIPNLATVPDRGREALTRLLADRIAGRPVLQDVSLTDTQVDELLAFLEALTDPCARDPACLARWIPDTRLGVDPNGDQLEARFR